MLCVSHGYLTIKYPPLPLHIYTLQGESFANLRQDVTVWWKLDHSLYLDYRRYSKSVHAVFGPIRGITAHNWPFRAPVTLEIICVQCQHLGDNCLGNPPSQGPSSILLSQNLANMPQSVYFFCIDIPLQHVDNIWRHIGCCWLDCSSVELMQLLLQLRTDLRWILEMTQKWLQPGQSVTVFVAQFPLQIQYSYSPTWVNDYKNRPNVQLRIYPMRRQNFFKWPTRCLVMCSFIAPPASQISESGHNSFVISVKIIYNFWPLLTAQHRCSYYRFEIKR